MASVSFRDIQKSFGKVKVIQGIDFDIRDGEFVVLVGPSGCGKSTLLRMLAGREEISGGEIRVDDKVVNDLESKDRDIAMVFQSYALYPHMTVGENMAFSLKLRKADAKTIAERVDKAARILNLDQLLHRYPRELSGGQRQRVAMGRAIVRDPKVFLFDEPLSNLDAKLRTELRVEIKRLHHELGSTMIYVTHDQIEALTLADRIAVMNGGVIQQLASPKEIYRRPVNRFVAGFVGSPAMNFVDGTLGLEGDRPHIVLADGTRIDLAGYEFEKPPTAGRKATLGVRPEQVDLRHRSDDSSVLPLELTLVEPMGADTLVWAHLAGTQFSVRVDGDDHVETPARIDAFFSPSHASIFDSESGARL